MTIRLGKTSTGVKTGPLRQPESSPITSAYQILETDELVTCDASGGAFEVTLPDATGDVGPLLFIKKTDDVANVTVVSFDGVQPIDGDTEVTLRFQYEMVVLAPHGTGWCLVGIWS